MNPEQIARDQPGKETMTDTVQTCAYGLLQASVATLALQPGAGPLYHRDHLLGATHPLTSHHTSKKTSTAYRIPLQPPPALAVHPAESYAPTQIWTSPSPCAAREPLSAPTPSAPLTWTSPTANTTLNQ